MISRTISLQLKLATMKKHVSQCKDIFVFENIIHYTFTCISVRISVSRITNSYYSCIYKPQCKLPCSSLYMYIHSYLANYIWYIWSPHSQQVISKWNACMIKLCLLYGFASAGSNYTCTSNNETINVDMLCDGMSDCGDGSDENNILCSGRSYMC